MKNLCIEPNEKILVRAATSGVVVWPARLKTVTVSRHISWVLVISGSKHRLKHQAYDDIIIDQDGRLETEDKFDKILELVGPRTNGRLFDHIAEGDYLCHWSLGSVGAG